MAITTATDRGVCQLSYTLEGKAQHIKISQEQCIIGRAETCDITIPLPSVSRMHARLLRDDDGWTVVDQNSRNGITVNGRRFSSTRLQHEDLISLGPKVQLRFQILSPPGPVFEPPQQSVTADLTRLIRVDDFRQRLQAKPSQTSTLSDASDPTSQDVSHWAIPLFSRAAETLILPLDLEEMFHRVVDLLFENLPAERGCVFQIDSLSGERCLKVRRRKHNAGRTDSFEVSDSVISRALEQRSAVLVIDSLNDQQFSTSDSIITNRICSVMCAPLIYDQHITGLIYVDSQDVERLFNEHHLEALTALACLSAAAIHQAQLRERILHEENIRQRLERYSAPSVVDRIVASSASNELGMIAEECEVSVLFLDIVRFTTLSEHLPPAEVLAMLNNLFTRLTDCVFDQEGTLDKFTGDGLMAVFGAPLPQGDHALRAVRTALAMHHKLRAFNSDFHYNLQIRIGINSGPVLAGDVGSERRRDFTVIGDTVNTASRLEAQVAQPGDIVLGPSTYQQVAAMVSCDALGELALKGRSEPLSVYRVHPEAPHLD